MSGPHDTYDLPGTVPPLKQGCVLPGLGRIVRDVGASSQGHHFIVDASGRYLHLKVLFAPHRVDRTVLKAWSSAGSSHLLRVHRMGRIVGHDVWAGEQLEGTTLALHTLPLGLSELRRLGSEAAEALAALHSAGIVHTDVNPENLIFVPGGRGWVILDPDSARRSGTPAAIPSRVSLLQAPEARSPGCPATPTQDGYGLAACLVYAALASASPALRMRGLSDAQRDDVESLRGRLQGRMDDATLRFVVAFLTDARLRGADSGIRAFAQGRAVRIPDEREYDLRVLRAQIDALVSDVLLHHGFAPIETLVVSDRDYGAVDDPARLRALVGRARTLHQRLGRTSGNGPMLSNVTRDTVRGALVHGIVGRLPDSKGYRHPPSSVADVVGADVPHAIPQAEFERFQASIAERQRLRSQKRREGWARALHLSGGVLLAIIGGVLALVAFTVYVAFSLL